MEGEVLIAVVLAVGALAGVIVLGFFVANLRGRVKAIPRDGDLYAAINRIDDDLANVEEAIVRLQPIVESLDSRMPGALRYAAVVTFDAHEDRTGQQSRAIALLNERRDGIVITLLHGIRDTLFFIKMVRDGRGIEPLTPEEELAVERALEG